MLSERMSLPSLSEPPPAVAATDTATGERFAWLLATEPSPGPPASVSEFRAACEVALSFYKVLPAIAPRLLAWGGPEASADPAADRVRDFATTLSALGSLQTIFCGRLVDELSRRGIEHTLLKGSATRWILYDDPGHRVGLDTDLGVAEGDLERARRAILATGFTAANWDQGSSCFRVAHPVRQAIAEAFDIELGFMVRRQVVTDLPVPLEETIRRTIEDPAWNLPDTWHLTERGELACYLTVDLHHSIGTELPVASILESTQVRPGPGFELRLPSPAWLLFHALYKLYWEAVHRYGQGVDQYADLVRLLAQCETRDVAELDRLVVENRLEAGAFYVLRRIEPHLGTTLSPPLRALMLRGAEPPDRLYPLEVKDLGDMWPKMWRYR